MYATSKNDSNFNSRDSHFDHIFDFEKNAKMAEVPQFYSAANLRDSHASMWK